MMDLANRCYIRSLECVYNNVHRMNSSVIASSIITDEIKLEQKLKVGKPWKKLNTKSSSEITGNASSSQNEFIVLQRIFGFVQIWKARRVAEMENRFASHNFLRRWRSPIHNQSKQSLLHQHRYDHHHPQSHPIHNVRNPRLSRTRRSTRRRRHLPRLSRRTHNRPNSHFL